jgi:subtilase family serine protease
MQRRAWLAALAFVAIAAQFTVPAAAQDRFRAPQVTQAVDDSHRTTLTGNVRPEANAGNDRGLVSDGLSLPHMLLQLKRSAEQEQAAASNVASLYDATSPNYHHWLTAQQFGAQFGVDPADIAKVTAWLASHGFTVNQVYPNGMVIDFSGTAGQIRGAFRTEIHRLDVGGASHIANMTDPQVPAALAPVIEGVVSLHDFRPHPSVHARPDYTFKSGGYTYQTVVPGDLAVIYNLKPLFTAGLTGVGQTIVVIEDSNVYSTADWTTFRSTFGLSSYSSGSFTQVHPGSNCSNPGDVVDDDFEAIIDAEWASAAAPSAAIELASCADTNTTFGGLIAFQNLVNGANPPKIFSISYGECEAFNGASSNAAYNTAYQQAAGEGISVFVAAGDWGGAVCDAGIGNETVATHGIGVNAFASTPYNVAVGGTDFEDTYLGTNSTYWTSTNSSTYVSAKSYVPEIPWNDSCASTLTAKYSTGSTITYGSSGFCNSRSGREFLSIIAGSGGPSACATGKPSSSGVIGGSCAGYAKPTWQSVLGNPADNVRDLPDISLFAADGLWGHYYVTCYSNRRGGGAACTGSPANWAGGGGTSFASPIMAAIQALVNENQGSAQGLPNPVYYQLASAEFTASKTNCLSSNGASASASGCVFYDIAVGDMNIDCSGKNNCYLPSGNDGVLSTSNSSYAPAFTAGTGWDFATGLGSVNAYNLVANWPGAVTGTSTKVAKK